MYNPIPNKIEMRKYFPTHSSNITGIQKSHRQIIAKALQSKMEVKNTPLFSNRSCANNTPVAMANQICDLEAFCKAYVWILVKI